MRAHTHMRTVTHTQPTLSLILMSAQQMRTLSPVSGRHIRQSLEEGYWTVRLGAWHGPLAPECTHVFALLFGLFLGSSSSVSSEAMMMSYRPSLNWLTMWHLLTHTPITDQTPDTQLELTPASGPLSQLIFTFFLSFFLFVIVGRGTVLKTNHTYLT